MRLLCGFEAYLNNCKKLHFKKLVLKKGRKRFQKLEMTNQSAVEVAACREQSP